MNGQALRLSSYSCMHHRLQWCPSIFNICAHTRERAPVRVAGLTFLRELLPMLFVVARYKVSAMLLLEGFEQKPARQLYNLYHNTDVEYWLYLTCTLLLVDLYLLVKVGKFSLALALAVGTTTFKYYLILQVLLPCAAPTCNPTMYTTSVQGNWLHHASPDPWQLHHNILLQCYPHYNNYYTILLGKR